MSSAGYVIQISGERLEKPEKPTAIFACFQKRHTSFFTGHNIPVILAGFLYLSILVLRANRVNL